MIVYKIVTDTLCSIWADYTNICVQYKVGAWVRPRRWAQRKGFYLLAFQDLDAAETWAVNRFDARPIYRAQA